MVRGTRNSTRAITPIRETRLSSSTTDPLTATGRRVLRSHTKNGGVPDAEAEQQSPSKRPSASRTLAARGRTRRSSAAEFNFNKLPHDTSPIKESSPIKADDEETSRSEQPVTQPVTPSAAPRTRKGRASSGKRASIVYRSENPEQSDNIESPQKKEEESVNSPLRALNAENINNRSPVRLRSSPRKKASVNLEYAEKKPEVGSPTKDADQSNEVTSQSPTVASSPVKQTSDESSADAETVTMPAETEQAAEVEPTDTQLPTANTEEVHQQLDPNDSMIVEVPGAYLDPALVPHSNSSTFNSPVQIANSSKPPSLDGLEPSVTYTEQLFSASSPIAITTSMIDPALLSSPLVAPNSYAASFDAPPSPSLLSTPTSLPWERADNSVIEESSLPLSTVVSPEAVSADTTAEKASTTDLTQEFSAKSSSTPADDDMARRKMIARKREEEIAAHRSAYYDRLKREFKIPHIPNTPSRLAVSRTSYDTSTEVTSDCAPSSPLAGTATSAAVVPSSPVVVRSPSKQEVLFTRTLSAESDSDNDEFMDTVESIDIAPAAPSAPIQQVENVVVEETISTQTEAQENVDAESRSIQPPAEDVSSMADLSTITDSDTEPEVFVEAHSPIAHAQTESAESATSTAAADETSMDVSNLSTINRWERQVRRREGFWSQSAINTPAGTPMQQQLAGPGSSALRFALSLISPIRRASPAPVRVHSPLAISTTVEAEEAEVVFPSPLKVEIAAEEAVECSKADSVVDEDIELPDVDEPEAEVSVLSDKAEAEVVSIEKQAETSTSHTEASFTDEESVVTAKNELSINNEDEDKEEESSSASSVSSSDADAASDNTEIVAPAVVDEPTVVKEEQVEEQPIMANESVSENVDIPASVESEEGDEEVEMDVDSNCSSEIEAHAEASADDAETEAVDEEDAAEDAAEDVDVATVTVSETISTVEESQSTEEVRELQSEAEVSVEVEFVEAVTGEEDVAANVSAEDSTRGEDAEEFHECSVATEISPDASKMATPETEAQAEVEVEAEVETTGGSDTAAHENESTEKSELKQAEHESAEDTTAITQTSDKSDVSSGEVDYTSVLPWHISLDKWAESNKRKRAVVEEPAPVASTQGDAAAEAEMEATSTEKKTENAVEDEESQRPRKKVRSSSRSVNSRNEEPAKQLQRAQIPLPRKKQPATAARTSRRGRGAAEQSSLSTASSIPVVSSRASEASTATATTAATATPARATRSRAGTRGGVARAPDTPKPMVRSGGLGGGAGNAPLARITATNSRLNNGYENNVIPQYQRIEAQRPDSPPLDKRRKRLFESPLGRERAISFAERVVVAGNGRGKKRVTVTRKDEKKPKKGIMKQAPGRLDEFGNALDVVSVPAKDTVRVRHRLYLGEQEEPTRYARKENIR